MQHKSSNKWTEAEETELMRLWAETRLSIDAIAKQFGRSELAIRSRIMKVLEELRK